MILGRHLGQQQADVAAAAHDQAVAADHDAARIQRRRRERSSRQQYRDLEREVGKLVRCHRREARVVPRRGYGHLAYDVAERPLVRDVADAAA